MEKYGVELDEEKVKTAEKTNKFKCPSCGADAQPGMCPNCGTEPFEKKPPDLKKGAIENIPGTYKLNFDDTIVCERPEAPVKGRFSDDCTFDDDEK